MTALVGGEVQGKVSVVLGLPGLRAQAENAGSEDLTDLGEPLGWGHQVGVKGVWQSGYDPGECLALMITYQNRERTVGSCATAVSSYIIAATIKPSYWCPP